MTIKDAQGQPVYGVWITLQTNHAPGIHFCVPTTETYAVTDPAGRAIFQLKGGGSDTRSFKVFVGNFEGGFFLCSPRPRSPDLNGDLVVDALDQAIHAGLPSNSPTGDFDCDGDTDPQDRLLLDERLGQRCQIADVDPTPNDVGIDLQVYPNPSRGDVTLEFEVRRLGRVSLRIEDLAGRAVRTLLTGTSPPGTYQLRWDGLADDGTRVRAGLYFYDLVVGDERRIQRAVIVR